jgi:hypothetical protein
MRVVATLTTMPDKYINSDKLLVSLKSLNNQTYKLDKIYLGLPYKCERLNIDYPEISDEIKNLCTIVRCEDYGPITKIISALLMEDDCETIIITFDDDFKYSENLVEKLIEKHKLYPNSSIGSSGMLLKNICPNCAIYPNGNSIFYDMSKFKIPKEGRKVDSIYGFSGVLYIRKFFPRKENLYDEFIKYALIDENIRMNDDISISGYLSMKNIERRIFKDLPTLNISFNKNNTEISSDILIFLKKLNLAILTAKSIGMYKNTEYICDTETISFKILIITFILLFIIFLLFKSSYINHIYSQKIMSIQNLNF